MFLAQTWLNLKVIVLSELNQSHKKQQHRLGWFFVFFLLSRMSGEHKNKECTQMWERKGEGREEGVIKIRGYDQAQSIHVHKCSKEPSLCEMNIH